MKKKNIIINLEDANSKCYIHSEDYISYCNQCNKSICHICIANKEHLFHKKNFLNEIISQDIREKDIFLLNKIFKEEKEKLLKRIEELDNLIKLNELLINAYKNYPYNYNYVKNIDNLFRKNILKEYQNDINKKKFLIKFNNSNNISYLII